MGIRSVAGCVFLWIVAAFALPTVTVSAEIKENTAEVDARNAFAENILRLHRRRLASGNVNETSQVGGYAGMPGYYNEVEYRDRASRRLLSRIRWIREQPDTPQMIELFIHDGEGRVAIDYYVSYLTDFRNAPMAALVNVHFYNGDLHSFRQFDSSGDVLFERCEGRRHGNPVDIALEEGEFPPSPKKVPHELYDACFAALPKVLGDHLDATKMAVRHRN